MKSGLRFVILGDMLLLLLAIQSISEEVQWTGTLKEAVREARDRNVPILIFYGEDG